MRRGRGGRARRALSAAAAVILAGAAGTVAFPATAASPSPKPKVIKAIQHDRSAPLSAMHGAPSTGHKLAKLPGHPTSTTPPSSLIGGDPILQTTPPAATGPALAGSFEGIGNGIPGYSVNLAPSDVNGAIGPNHYVQIANASLAVFSRTGSILLGPEPISTLWTGFGGLCETTNGGDPIALYDRAADRWLISQLAYQGSNGTSVPYFNCVAVSATNDPTGAYNRYAFPRSELPDYAKFSVWPDAYYMTDNDFQNGSSFTGATFAALDRNAIIAGSAATMIVFSIAYASLLPAGQDGATPPPPGSPGYALALSGTNALAEFRLHADFATPNNSTLTGPLSIPVAPFRELCNGFNSCVPQAGPGYYLASLGDRLMYRVAYRNFGDHESLVASHSVDPGGGGSISGGVRWYELRDPGGTPTLYQQGTFAPDANFRWMGSMAMDARGDIGVGYSVSGPSLAPGIAMTGRLAGDPLGALPQGETSVIQGSGVQTGTDRWGDYTSMAIDPVDDCTFWYTNQYLTATGGFNWHTRVGSFRYPSCAQAASSTTLTSTPNPSSGGPVTLTATVTGGATTPTGTVTFQDGDAILSSAPLAAGQATVSVSLLGGTRQLAATYSGDSNYSGSSSPLVNETVNLPATSTSLATSASTSFAGHPVTFTAVVTGSSPTGRVSFNDGGLTLASVALSNGSATLTTGSLAVGPHSVSATYSGDTANASSASTTVSVTVGGPAYSLIYSFTGGADSGAAQSGLVQGPDGAFYGVTSLQGSSTYGTIFRFTPAGGVTTLHTFAPADGGVSRSKLLVGADGALYGTSQASSANSGTVWKITTQGVFTVLHTFSGADGSGPSGGLVQDAAGNLYGWTINGGQFSCGTAYSLGPTGVLTTLFPFTCGPDGSGPQGAPVFGADGNLYGVTFLGGAHNQGTIFKITPAGALTTLYAFQDSTDGALPQAGLLLAADGNFYGTTSVGAGGRGTIFRITPAGAFTLVYSLTPGDGAAPLSGLVQDSTGNLFGETAFTNPGSPVNQAGSIFEVTAGGTFVQLKGLLAFSLGQQPRGGLVIGSDGNLYGTDDQGGASGLGGIFSVAPPGPLTLQPSTLSNLSEGFNFSLQVASVSGGAAPYAGTIDWGDGTTSAATFNGSVVGGQHAWAEESPSGSPYTVKVTVTDSSGQSATVTDAAAVADGGINANPAANQSVTEGVGWSGTLATFTDVDPGGVVSDYTATIDWTDGTVTSGTISGTGPFSVSGSHTYRTAGNHSAIVTFTDVGGASNYVVIGFAVADAALSGSGTLITGSESSTTNATVASFTDANPFAQPSDFTATITWGDGSTSSGSISGSNGTFIVTGSHLYGEGGTYPTSVKIVDYAGSTLTVSGSATISDYPISVTGLTAKVKKSFSGTLATLRDGDPGATASDYRVTIDWGDGTTSAGSVSGSAPFTISGTHNYKTNGTYTVTISVTDNGGATATATTTLITR